jgi:outer membrane cobalamin receptor
VRHGYARENRWNEWLIMPAVRFDNSSDAGQRLTPKLGLMWRRQGEIGLTACMNAGQSFRVPNLNELFWPGSSFYSGNPNLKPETGTNVDGGFILQIPHKGNWQVEVNGFYSTLDNLIIDTPEASGRLMPQNIEKAKLRGIESALAWHSSGDRLRLKIAHTYLKATNETEANRGKRIVYRPQDKLDASVGLTIAQVHLSVAYQFVGKRFIDPENRSLLRDYRLVNFAMGRQQRVGNIRAEFHAEVRNVYDKHFSVLDGYPVPGREFRATVRLGY